MKCHKKSAKQTSSNLLAESQHCYYIISNKQTGEKSARKETVTSYFSCQNQGINTWISWQPIPLRKFFNSNKNKTNKQKFINYCPNQPKKYTFIECKRAILVSNQEFIKVLDTCKYRTRQNNSSIPSDVQFRSGLTKHMQKLSSIKSINSFINSGWGNSLVRISKIKKTALTSALSEGCLLKIHLKPHFDFFVHSVLPTSWTSSFGKFVSKSLSCNTFTVFGSSVTYFERKKK